MKPLLNFSLKRLAIATALLLSGSVVIAQNSKDAAVLGVYINEVDISPEVAADMLRIELSKIQVYHMLDKLDLMEVEQNSEIEFINCYGRSCLAKAGNEAELDFSVAGAVESLGPKLVVTLKIYNVNRGDYEKTLSMEFYDNIDELQRMMRIVVRKAHGLENEREIVEMLTFYEQAPTTQRSKLKNDGPRFGLAYIGGDAGDIMRLPESKGGYDVMPLMSQFGYQLEKAYISSGDFEALVEGLFLVSGIEQNMFIPNLALLNGFRSTKSGWEVGFGPSFSLRKMASGYLDSANVFVLGARPDGTEFERIKQVDSRGTTEFSAAWVWALGKTFRSGYLNIPVNVFFSHGKHGWNLGMSMGFNISR